MGNEITKKYELPPEHNATAGLLQLWKIYPGVKLTKDMVKKDISVWIMSRDALAKRDPFPITEKNVLEQIFQILRKDLMTMKEMNHGGIVKIIEVSSLSLSLCYDNKFTILSDRRGGSQRYCICD
jgi:hypothetical protein